MEQDVKLPEAKGLDFQGPVPEIRDLQDWLNQKKNAITKFRMAFPSDIVLERHPTTRIPVFIKMLLVTVVLVFIYLGSRAVNRFDKDVQVDIDTSQFINIVDESYLSFTIDTSIFQPVFRWQRFNFSSVSVHTLMKGLAPATLRVGGSSADWLFFDKTYAVLTPLGLLPHSQVVTKHNISDLVQLVRASGTRLLFDLNLQFRFGDQWDPSNAIELFDFCTQMGYCDSIDWELGNEPEWYAREGRHAAILTGQQIANDFLMLRKLLRNYSSCNNGIVGPDVGVPSASVGAKILSSVVNTTGNFLKGATFHHYYFDATNKTYKDYINPEYFARLEHTIKAAKSVVEKTQYPTVSLWIGETSTGYNSGNANVSDRFVAGFLWMDNLGLSAAMGVKVVMRQCFYQGYYSLLNETMDPNPDYWLSWMHKKLVGRGVFDVTYTSAVSPPTTRVYAHCTNTDKSTYKPGSLTVFALNVNPTTSSVLKFSDTLAAQYVDVFLLEADGPDGLLSRWVKVNGQRMKMKSETIMPTVTPVQLPPGSKIELPPVTMGFFVFKNAHVKLCMP